MIGKRYPHVGTGISLSNPFSTSGVQGLHPNPVEYYPQGSQRGSALGTPGVVGRLASLGAPVCSETLRNKHLTVVTPFHCILRFGLLVVFYCCTLLL